MDAAAVAPVSTGAPPASAAEPLLHIDGLHLWMRSFEGEALVLAGLDHLGEQLVDEDARTGLEALRREIGTAAPEDVNDGKESTPSKRLLARVPGYHKTTHGPLVTAKVGIHTLKQRCPRFGDWVSALEALK